MNYRAFSHAPDAIMVLAKTHLNDYAQIRGAELGITMPVLTDFFDYDPGPLAGGDWRFQVWSEDGPTHLDGGGDNIVAWSELTLLVGVRGTSGDLGSLAHTLRAFNDAMMRMFADEAGRGEGTGIVDVTRATMSLPLKGEKSDWYAHSAGLRVVFRCAEA